MTGTERARALADARERADYWRRVYGPDSNHLCALDAALSTAESQLRDAQEALRRSRVYVNEWRIHHGSYTATELLDHIDAVLARAEEPS